MDANPLSLTLGCVVKILKRITGDRDGLPYNNATIGATVSVARPYKSFKLMTVVQIYHYF
ncbi:MAG: hypothetical protein FWG65_09935 [Turicibacter sp.]|nr:hypothetical protein [Turicibacter sp.]